MFDAHFKILNRRVGPGEPCLIIGEAGVNHFGDLEKGKDLVDMVTESGADVFKTQAFSTDQLISNSLPSWKNRMRSKEVDLEFLQTLKERCDRQGLVFMCTAHDQLALNWLKKLDVVAHKIGSGEKENYEFIRQHAETNKPLIISTGMQDKKGIRETVRCVENTDNTKLAILHCITSYPTPYEEVNLNSLATLKNLFPGPVGYSDHCKGIVAILGAVALGASIVEKHISLDFEVPDAQDWKVASNRDELNRLVVEVRQLEKMLGSAALEVRDCEMASTKWALKRVVADRDLDEGNVIARKDLVTKRAEAGISPKDIDKIVGTRLLRSIKKDWPINWKDIQ